MQQVFPPVGYDKFRHDHRQGILWMTQMHRINIGEDRTQEGAVRRLNDEQMGLFLCCDLLLPLLPACPYLLDLLVVDHHMHRCDVTGDGASIGQTRESSAIQPSKWHNEPMMNLLRTGGKRAHAGLLQHWYIGHHNILSEEQRRFQSKNFWTIEQASQRGLHHFRQDNCQSLLRILLMHRVNIVKQWKELAPCRWGCLRCSMRQVKIVEQWIGGLAIPRIDDVQ